MKLTKTFCIFFLCAFLSAFTASAATETTVQEILASGETHIGEEIQFNGLLIGVCKHGGKKGFFKSEDGDSPTLRVEIVEGRPFDRMDVGHIVSITGSLDELRIDENYLSQWEAEIIESHHEHESSKSYCEGACATGGEETPELKRVETMRKQLEESGKDHLSVIWVNATDWEVTNEE
jgi:hypothetical protein